MADSFATPNSERANCPNVFICDIQKPTATDNVFALIPLLKASFKSDGMEESAFKIAACNPGNAGTADTIASIFVVFRLLLFGTLKASPAAVTQEILVHWAPPTTSTVPITAENPLLMKYCAEQIAERGQGYAAATWPFSDTVNI
jgi:hypothetical protein